MARIAVKIEGLSELTQQLADISNNADDTIAEIINDTLEETRNYAVLGIQRGPKTGRVYETYFWTDGQGRVRPGRERSRPHQASAPGEYPATDEGRLASSIGVDLATPGRLTGYAGTALGYGALLEFGTSKMAARPWLQPSFEKAKIDVEAELKQRFEGKI